MKESKKESIRRRLRENKDPRPVKPSLPEASDEAPKPIRLGVDRFKGFRPGKMSSGEMLLEEIIEDESQPRQYFDETSLQELANSIEIHGVRTPIEIRWDEEKNKWKIISGNRRFKASKIAGKTTIPCTIQGENLDEKTILELQIIENLQREDLLPMETAKALKNLMKVADLSYREAADQVGKSHMTVKRHLDLLTLPDEVQQKVEHGEVAPSVAANLTKLETPTLQKKVANTISSKKLNRKEANQEIELHVKNKKKVKPTSASDVKKKLYWDCDQIKIYGRSDFKEAELRNALMEIANKISLSKSAS